MTPEEKVKTLAKSAEGTLASVRTADGEYKRGYGDAIEAVLSGFGMDWGLRTIVADIEASEKTFSPRDLVEDLAAEPCEYGDNCPPLGTRHGECLHCKARRALQSEGKT